MTGAEEDYESLEQPQPGEVDPKMNCHMQSIMNISHERCFQECDRSNSSGLITKTESEHALYERIYDSGVGRGLYDFSHQPIDHSIMITTGQEL
jgi:hypothetical protein